VPEPPESRDPRDLVVLSTSQEMPGPNSSPDETIHLASPTTGHIGTARQSSEARRRSNRRGSSLPSFAWFAGVPRGAFSREACRTEAPLYNAIGFAVLITAVLSGWAATVALGDVLQKPASSLWPFGLIWGVFILNLDRMLQMVTASKRMFLAVLPRLAICLVIGILISEPLLLSFNAPEINNYLSNQVQQQIQGSTGSISSFYQPKIAADQEQIAAIQNKESALTAQIAQDTFVANCEAGEVACSLTHELGCGPVCQHYQQLAADAQAQLNDEKPGDSATVQRLNTEIQHLQTTEGQAVNTRTGSIKAGSGFIAREEALTHIMAVHRVVFYEVWLIRIALWLLDLLPLLIKFMHISLGTPAYERIVASRRSQEALGAHRIDVETKVEKDRIDQQGVADTEVNRVTVLVDRDRRITQTEGQWVGEPNSSGTYATTAASSDQVKAMSFDEFVNAMKGHHHTPVPVSGALRAAGWVGTSLIGALTICLAATTYYAHTVVTGEWLAFLLFPAALSLAALTKGFREAPQWAIKATFGTLLVGLALPVVIVALNL
jgi:hypothetical protein